MADIFVHDANLVSFMEKTGYNITQENGLRKFGPPPGWIGPPPPKESEIFIGKLPRDIYENELVPLCEQFGKIYELRLMMDFNGENRGYSFVTYINIDDATEAVKHLDDYEIRPGRHIGVCKSIDNCRLFVGGIPKDKSKEEIMAEISKYTEGVSKVILYSSIVDKSKNRGFAFVEYETHLVAAMARRRLLASKIKLFDHDIAVDWAQPEAQVEEETMNREERARGDARRYYHSAILGSHQHHPSHCRGHHRNNDPHMVDEWNNYIAAGRSFHSPYPVYRYPEMSTEERARGDARRYYYSAILGSHQHHPSHCRGQHRNNDPHMVDEWNNYIAAGRSFHSPYPVYRYPEMSTEERARGDARRYYHSAILGSHQHHPSHCRGHHRNNDPHMVDEWNNYIAAGRSFHSPYPVYRNPEMSTIPMTQQRDAYDEETFVQSMPIFLDSSGRQSKMSGSSSSSSLLSTKWKYSSYRWIKKSNTGRYDRKFGSRRMNEFKTAAIGDFFPFSSSLSSVESTIVEPGGSNISSPLKKLLGSGLACVRCERQMVKNSDVKFTNLECYHTACNPCCSFLFRRKTSLPVNCPKCHKVIRRRKNREMEF